MDSLNPTRELPSCTVIICTRNRPRSLEQCLAAVSRLDYPGLEVLVVDNAPEDDAGRQLAARSGCAYVVEPEIGLSRARNRGVQTSRTELVAFLDDDALPDSAWLKVLAREFDDPQVMAVTGRTHPPSSDLEITVFCELLQGSPERRCNRLVVDRNTDYWFERANFGGLGAGMNMAFRRRAFDDWPGFDPRLGRGAIMDSSEENYAFFNLIDRGYRVVYTPQAIVRHPTDRTLDEFRERYLKDCAASSGYFAFLFFEQPRYRRQVLHYLARSLRGGNGQVNNHNGSAHHVVPRWRVLLARLQGPLLYARLRARNGSEPHPSLEISHE